MGTMGIYLSKSQLERSPSRADGVSAEEEKRLVRWHIKVIQRAGQNLNLPIITISTACTFFHRFYSAYSLAKHAPLVISQGCLLLASKSEENSRRIRDILNTTYAVNFSDREPLRVSTEYWKMKEQVLRAEQILLRAFAFDMAPAHPHHYLLHFIRDLEATEDVATMAWCVSNDSLCSPLCLQYSAQTIACACILFAADLTNTHPFVGEWWEKYATNRIQLEDAAHQLADLYEEELEAKVPASHTAVPLRGGMS